VAVKTENQFSRSDMKHFKSDDSPHMLTLFSHKSSSS
jgi:hypothetical protein